MLRKELIWCLALCTISLARPHLTCRADDNLVLDSRRAAAVKKLLDLGFQPTRLSADQVEAAVRAGEQSLGEQNPFYDYACYLVLSKNLQNESAAARLESAVRASPVVLPAREEWIRLKLRERKYSEALEDLVDLAADVGSIDENDPMTVEAHQTSQWIGVAITFLKGPLGDEQVAREAGIVSVLLRDRLGETYTNSFDRGVTEAGLIYHDLSCQIIGATKLAEDQKLLATQETEQRVAEVESRKQQLTESAGTLKEVTEEGLGDLTSKITALEKLFEISMKNEQAILTSQVQLQAEILQLRQQLHVTQNQVVRRPGVPVASTIASQQDVQRAIGVKELQFTALASELAVLLQQREQLVRQGNSLMAQRQQAASSYKSRAGDVQQQFAALEKLKSRMEAAAKQKANQDVSRLPEVTSVKRRLRETSTYWNHSLEAQEKRLLELVTSVTATGN